MDFAQIPNQCAIETHTKQRRLFDIENLKTITENKKKQQINSMKFTHREKDTPNKSSKKKIECKPHHDDRNV